MEKRKDSGGMGKIQVMDCTLRDGGYLNDWKFGKETIYGVTREVPKTGVDIFELCFMRDQPFSEDRCVFSSVESMAGILNKVPGVKYAAMIETGCLLPIEMLSERRPDSIDLIRFIMWKNKMDLAYDYCRQVKEKGYDFCVQPTRTDQYSLEEFRDLILRFNELKPYGLYIVDTFGLFTKKRFLEYVEVADRYLDPDLALGYHAHNNLQQAVGNAQAFIELGLERDIIVDASVMGIGRGAGNLPLEIIGRYLNENGIGEFDIDQILGISDTYIRKVYEEHPWGYSIPYYLTATMGCNPNYADSSLSQGLSVEQMREFFNWMPEMERIRFNPENVLKFLGKK